MQIPGNDAQRSLRKSCPRTVSEPILTASYLVLLCFGSRFLQASTAESTLTCSVPSSLGLEKSFISLGFSQRLSHDYLLIFFFS